MISFDQKESISLGLTEFLVNLKMVKSEKTTRSAAITLCLRVQSVNCGRSVKRETHPPKIVYTQKSGISPDFRGDSEGSELMGFVSGARVRP